jgi:16S rRNA (uracil1498-N3)-methyltransferase
MKDRAEYNRQIIRAMHARFHAPDAQTPGDLVSLPADEAEHLTRVLRLGVGDRVRVFNGRGLEFISVVEQAGRSAVLVRLEAPSVPAPEPAVAITLVQAVLKGDKMDAVVRDAVMLGAAAVVPIVTTRTEVSLATLARGHRIERWQRIAVSSAKQCGRAVVPVVRDPCTFETVPAAIGNRSLPAPGLMLVEPGASTDTIALGDLDLARPAEASLLVGPEGGWTAEEITAASAVCRLISFGRRTLRADSMAVIGLTAAFTVWKEF